MRIRSRLRVLAWTILALGLVYLPPVTAVEEPCGWGGSAPPARFDHVVWIIYENKTADAVFGGGHAPYITDLAARCGRPNDANHLQKVSLPNYIALTSGDTGGIDTNRGPDTWPQSGPSLFEQLGSEWRELNESMPSNCYMGRSGYFTVNHAPAHYYTRIREACQDQSVPLGATPDISARFTLIIPNKLHDMHRTDETPTVPSRIRAGDEWTAEIMPELLASPEYQAGRTVIMLLWDEATTRSSRVPMVVVSPYTSPGTRSTTRFDHYAVLKATQEMLGLTPLLGHAGDAGVPSIGADFGLAPY